MQSDLLSFHGISAVEGHATCMWNSMWQTLLKSAIWCPTGLVFCLCLLQGWYPAHFPLDKYSVDKIRSSASTVNEFKHNSCRAAQRTAEWILALPVTITHLPRVRVWQWNPFHWDWHVLGLVQCLHVWSSSCVPGMHSPSVSMGEYSRTCHEHLRTLDDCMRQTCIWDSSLRLNA